MSVEMVTFILAIFIAMVILVILPLGISRKIRMKVLLISVLLILLAYLLYILYSLVVSLISLGILLLVFSYLLGKELTIAPELHVDEDDDIFEEEEEEEAMDEPVVEEHFSSSERLKQESIDQILKAALLEDQDKVPLTTESKEEIVVNEDKLEEKEFVKDDLVLDDKASNEDVFEDLDDVEDILQNRQRTTLLSNEDDDEGESLLAHAEVHQDEEEDGPMLGRQFAEMEEEDALPPRPSAFVEEDDSDRDENQDVEEGTPLLGRQFEDDDEGEDGLPPRPSAFESEELDIVTESPILIEDTKQPMDDLDEDHSLFIGRELMDEEDEIAVILDTEDQDEKEELRDELNLSDRKLVEVEDEFLERKKERSQEMKKVGDSETTSTDELANSILMKRSELFDRLEEDIFDDKK